MRAPRFLGPALLGVALVALAGALRRQTDAGAHVLERTQLIPAPLAETFRFFSDPSKIHDVTPPWAAFEIVRSEPLPMRAGTVNDYRIRWLGVPLTWRGLIIEYEQDRRFVDLLTGGPYRYWRHEHEFEARDGGTLMRDRVEYTLPFGALGRLVHRLVVARQLRQIFDERAAAIERLFTEGAADG